MNNLDFAVALAKEAGALMKTNFTLGMRKEWKDDHSPLTLTDTTINNMVLAATQKAYPDVSLVAEEGNNLVKGSTRAWVCDPVDGTIPFSHGIPTSVFGLALVEDGQVVLGVIYDPFMDRLFSAEKGKGAYLNKTRIQVSTQSSIAHSVIGAPRSSYIEAVRKTNAHVINVGSGLYLQSLVASGELLAFVSTAKYPWDVAPAKIIVEEAGGQVSNMEGDQERYDEETTHHLISNGRVHKQLLDLFKDIPRT